MVATPIGNLEDLTLRAIRVLQTCTRVIAEDTRRSRQLLSHLGIEGKPLDPLHAHSTDRDVARVVSRLEAGETIALVTDAGTPAISDPGDALVKAAIAKGVRIVPIPGASAVLAALVASGLAGASGFRFMGFLPREGASRRDAIATACAAAEPIVLFESPERTEATLVELADAMPDRPACVARELTKLHEEILRGSLRSLAHDRHEWRGEIAIVLGAWAPETRSDTIDDGSIDARIDAELDRGGHSKVVADVIAAWSGRPRREIYERVVRRKAERPRNA